MFQKKLNPHTHPKTGEPKNFRWCLRGAKRSVKHGQTQQRGPPAEILCFLFRLSISFVFIGSQHLFILAVKLFIFAVKMPLYIFMFAIFIPGKVTTR